MKAGHDARVKARKEREREKEERAAEEQRETLERETDLPAWSLKMRREHEVRYISFRRRAFGSLL